MVRYYANDILIPEFAHHLREGKKVVFTPRGASMRPFIEGGQDMVTLVKKDKVRVGDICLANIDVNARTVYVLHRVVSVNGNDVVLQGDGNLRGVENCSLNDILGTVIKIQTPWGRRKPLTRGTLWRHLCKPRWFWLKVYRHTILKYIYN